MKLSKSSFDITFSSVNSRKFNWAADKLAKFGVVQDECFE